VWVIPVVVGVLLVVAAVSDRRARRTGQPQRASADYWHAVHEARRENRTRLFRRM
jgi:hypothetical protein